MVLKLFVPFLLPINITKGILDRSNLCNRCHKGSFVFEVFPEFGT